MSIFYVNMLLLQTTRPHNQKACNRPWYLRKKQNLCIFFSPEGIAKTKCFMPFLANCPKLTDNEAFSSLKPYATEKSMQDMCKNAGIEMFLTLHKIYKNPKRLIPSILFFISK